MEKRVGVLPVQALIHSAGMREHVDRRTQEQTDREIALQLGKRLAIELFEIEKTAAAIWKSVDAAEHDIALCA